MHSRRVSDIDTGKLMEMFDGNLGNVGVEVCSGTVSYLLYGGDFHGLFVGAFVGHGVVCIGDMDDAGMDVNRFVGRLISFKRVEPFDSFSNARNAYGGKKKAAPACLPSPRTWWYVVYKLRFFTFLRSKRCVAAFVSNQISRYPILLWPSHAPLPLEVN